MISLHEIAKDIKLERDEQDKDKKVYKTDSGKWAGDYDGDIEYFDDAEKAKHWSQKGDMEFGDDGGDSKDDEDSAGKLGGSDFERDSNKAGDDDADDMKSQAAQDDKDAEDDLDSQIAQAQKDADDANQMAQQFGSMTQGGDSRYDSAATAANKKLSDLKKQKSQDSGSDDDLDNAFDHKGGGKLRKLAFKKDGDQKDKLSKIADQLDDLKDKYYDERSMSRDRYDAQVNRLKDEAKKVLSGDDEPDMDSDDGDDEKNAPEKENEQIEKELQNIAKDKGLTVGSEDANYGGEIHSLVGKDDDPDNVLGFHAAPNFDDDGNMTGEPQYAIELGMGSSPMYFGSKEEADAALEKIVDDEKIRKAMDGEGDETLFDLGDHAKSIVKGKDETITINGKQYKPIKEEKKKSNPRVLKEIYDRTFRSLK